TWPAEVVLDNPHCVFVPHVFVLFPSYYDHRTGQQKPTGQVFKIKNTGPLNHNANWQSAPPNRGDNKAVGPGAEIKVPPFKASPREITFGCNVHPWMRAYALVFDHPFAAVTARDGTYEIKNAPALTELTVMAWHEAAGYLNGKEGEILILKEGENVKDLKI